MPAHQVLLFPDSALRLFKANIENIPRQPSCTLTDSCIQRPALLNTQCSTDLLYRAVLALVCNLKPQPACLD